MKMYGLYSTEHKRLLGVTASATDGDYCGDIAYSLSLFYPSDDLWIVCDRKVAEAVAGTDTKWYNADYNSPRNSYAGKLEVVEFDMAVSGAIMDTHKTVSDGAV
ncbi:MAG: hypothetical protein DRH08_05835 [Deltaproteobacteria bacterium]|nr:MAG: hypothetical protein DRH08_05835 [Deltaproteobacteria bacterium]